MLLSLKCNNILAFIIIYFMKKISLNFFRKYLANIIICVAILCLGLITYHGGVVGVFSSNNSEIIYSGNAKNNTISIMINVYMGNEYVEQMIDILNQNEVKATFFVGGVWVEKNQECFMKIYNSGNEIGSHGYWHKDHSKLSDEQQINEIKLTESVVEGLTGFKMSLFAPPSGSFNKHTAYIAENLGYKTIMWSKDTIDWRDQDEQVIFDRATKNCQSGDLVLMHPTKASAECLDRIIKEYKEKGLNIDTVSKNIL